MLYGFIQGPPPDPAFNFLADRGREGFQEEGQIMPGRGGLAGRGGRGIGDRGDKGSDRGGDRGGERGASRRHPRNYGGPNFDNVKNQIKFEKDKQVE